MQEKMENSPAELEAVRVEQRNVHTLSRDKGKTRRASAATSVNGQSVDQARQRAGGASAVHSASRSSDRLLAQDHLVQVAEHSVASASERERSSLLVQSRISLGGTSVAAALARDRAELSASGGAQRSGEQAAGGVTNTLSRQNRGRVAEIQAQRGGKRSKRASLASANVGQGTGSSIVVNSNPVSDRGESASAAKSNNVVGNVSDLRWKK